MKDLQDKIRDITKEELNSIIEGVILYFNMFNAIEENKKLSFEIIELPFGFEIKFEYYSGEINHKNFEEPWLGKDDEFLEGEPKHFDILITDTFQKLLNYIDICLIEIAKIEYTYETF